MAVHGTVCEGNITSDLRDAAKQTRLAEMATSSKPTVRRVHAMLSQSDEAVRHLAANCQGRQYLDFG